MSEEWGGETKWQNRLWLFGSTLYVCVCVCCCLSVGTIALLRCWESQAPWCLACWTGVSRGTFAWIRWLLRPFQVWLLHSGTSNMNLEAIKDGWIAGCLLTILFHCADTGSTQNPTDSWVLRQTDFTAVHNLIRPGNFLWATLTNMTIETLSYLNTSEAFSFIDYTKRIYKTFSYTEWHGQTQN